MSAFEWNALKLGPIRSWIDENRARLLILPAEEMYSELAVAVEAHFPFLDSASLLRKFSRAVRCVRKVNHVDASSQEDS